MKNQHYFCRNKIWIMATLWLFASCYDSEPWVNVTKPPTKGKVTITVEEAQASFENEIMSKATRVSSTREQDLISYSRHQFPFGDIIPKWSSGVASNTSKTAYYETPIRSSYFYRAWRHKRIGKNKKKEWICTKIIHKLLVMKDPETNKTHNYIELLIPTIHFINHHRTFNYNLITNDGNMLDFSGFKVYTTLDGHLVRVNEYKNGKRVRGVFLDGTADKETYQEMRRRALIMLKNTRISIRLPKVAMTRSYDEMEYEDGAWYVDGNGDIWVWESYWGEWILSGNIYGDDGEDGHIIDEVVVTPDPEPEIDDPYVPSPIPLIDGDTGDNSGEETEGGGGSSSIGSSGGSSTPVAPKAKAIFRNSGMTEANWNTVERMLDKIMVDCMGQALYNGLKNTLNGKTLTIQFIGKGNSAFDLNGGIRLRTDVVSGEFLHEMLHAYQSYRESYASMTNAKLNMEIETHYAQYLYQSALPEYKGSKWEKRDKYKSRWKNIVSLKRFMNEKGDLHPNADVAKFESHILNEVVPTLREAGYSSDRYPLDYDRLGIENFKNLKELTKNC